MEKLTLNDSRAWSRRLSPQTRRRPLSRLPTPEASRHSDDTLEVEYGVDDRNIAKRAKPASSSLHQGQSMTTPNSPFQLKPFEPPLGYQYAPQSPPYRGTEPQKPSLPPLKMVCRAYSSFLEASNISRYWARPCPVHHKHRPSSQHHSNRAPVSHSSLLRRISLSHSIPTRNNELNL